MSLIIKVVLISILIINIITDIKKIKSNKEVVKSYNKTYESQQELKRKIEERNKILKESQDETIKMNKYYKQLKDNILVDYDYLTEEVVKRINENSNNQN